MKQKDGPGVGWCWGLNEKADWKQNINAKLRSLELIPVLWRTPHCSWPGSVGITANSNLSHMWSFLQEFLLPAPLPAPLPHNPLMWEWGLPPLQLKDHWFHCNERSHGFIAIGPHPSSCQPPPDRRRNCYCLPTFFCRCSHNFSPKYSAPKWHNLFCKLCACKICMKKCVRLVVNRRCSGIWMHWFNRQLWPLLVLWP